MPNKSEDIASIFILLEIVAGITAGICYTNSLDEAESNLSDSIFHLYFVLNSIFFGITAFFGAITAFLIKRFDRVLIGTLLSMLGGIVFLIVHAIILPDPILSFLSLFGFIIGFNYYLLKE